MIKILIWYLADIYLVQFRSFAPFLIVMIFISSSSGALYDLEFEYTDSNGDISPLSSLGGSYVILDAMATWCAPCRLEMLHLQEIYSVVESEAQVTMLTMSMDPTSDTIGKVDTFMKEFDALWDFGLDHLTTLRDYLNVTGYPTTFIISPEGDILKSWPGLIDADTILTELDQYLDLRGSLGRQLQIGQLLGTLFTSPFFVIFLLMLWLVIFRIGYLFIKKLRAQPRVS